MTKEFNIERAHEIFEREENMRKAVRVHCKELGIEYEDKYRFRLIRYVNKSKKDDDIETVDITTDTNQYANDEKSFTMPSAWDSDTGKFLDIDQYCEKYNIPRDQVRSFKLVAHQQNHMTYNIAFKLTVTDETGIDEEFIENTVKQYIKPLTIDRNVKIIDNYRYFDRLVYTDVHIGMDPNGSKNIVPLYDGKWDIPEIMRRLEIMIDHVIKFKKGDILVIDDLGDYLDGLFGETTRGGHKLPQNMSDKEVYNFGIYFKLYLIEQLLPYYNNIICNSVTNDNHSGIFAYFVNKTVKDIIEIKYDNVEYNLLERFIEHFQFENRVNLLTHGKDSESLKFGFKPQLDTKQIEKIDQYCKEHNLYDGSYLELSKGDSHQAVYDYTTSNDFDYCNYPAFSIPSNWVKSNFKNSRSGFVFYNLDKESQITIKIPYFFE